MRLRPGARDFYDPIYRVTYVVIISRPEEFRPTLKKLLRVTVRPAPAASIWAWTTHDVSTCNGRVWRLEPGKAQVVVIWLRAGGDMGTLVHEVWHAARWVLETRGVRGISEDLDEPMAYYLQWITRRALGIPENDHQ